MNQRRLIFYDTETTGLFPDRDRVIEIAAYDPLQEKQFVSLINPAIPIPKEASQIHKITDAMVQNSPSFGEVMEQFCAFCEGDVILVAHNNDNFDKQFLRAEFERIERSMPDWQFLDSLKWARKYRPDLPKHQLQFLRECYGIPANQAHRAMDDVLVLAEIFQQMIDDLPPELLLELLDKPSQVVKMPFGKHQGMALERVPKDYLQWLAKSGALDKPENRELKNALETLGRL